MRGAGRFKLEITYNSYNDVTKPWRMTCALNGLRHTACAYYLIRVTGVRLKPDLRGLNWRRI